MIRNPTVAIRSSVFLLLIGFCCQSIKAGVRGDYKTPLFTVPFASTAPEIDGVVNDAEWQGALSINAIQTTDGAVSARQTRFWLMWDPDHLYIAMRSPLRPGERVMQA